MPLGKLLTVKEKLDKDQNDYVMCHSGVRSAKAGQLLAEEGYKVTSVI